MDFSSVFRTHDFLEDAAISYGFRKKGGVFTLERALPETDGLAAVVTVHGREMTVSVVELPDRVPYALFEVESAEGAFVDRVRQEAENLVRDVMENCFFDSDVRSRLLSYVKERYGTEQENLRVIYKDYCTLREHGTKKWYGLFMRIPWTSLHVERKGMTGISRRTIWTRCTGSAFFWTRKRIWMRRSGCWMRVMLSWRSPAGRAAGKSRNKGRGNL